MCGVGATSRRVATVIAMAMVVVLLLLVVVVASVVVVRENFLIKKAPLLLHAPFTPSPTRLLRYF